MATPEPRPPASSPCQAPPGYWYEDDGGADLHGTWTVVAFEMDGHAFPNGVGNRVTFAGGTMTTVGPDWPARRNNPCQVAGPPGGRCQADE